mmetsp:Transcript_33609/g.111168  ORF Transcript_33609/g.111168 Transcript_33609/m.111168 type:complete len:89 (-) Transcript_33609:146-412(-)
MLPPVEPRPRREQLPPLLATAAGAGAAAHLEADAGDAILFDYRLFHAGGANCSAVRRPIQYFVYARPWYSDEVNFPGPERSLWPAEVQ